QPGQYSACSRCYALRWRGDGRNVSKSQSNVAPQRNHPSGFAWLAEPSASGHKRHVLRSATFSPLAYRAFALILAGSLLANFGNQIQAVGAAWLLTENGAPADVIALAQTAAN